MKSDLEKHKIIIHFGLGAFFKAHLCSYIQALNDQKKRTIFNSCNKSKNECDSKKMAKQNNIYTVHARGNQQSIFEKIFCIQICMDGSLKIVEEYFLLNNIFEIFLEIKKINIQSSKLFRKY